MKIPGVAFKQLRILAPVLFVVVLVIVLNRSCVPDRYAWNQELKVEIDTPDGVKTGTAVTEVRWRGDIPTLSSAVPTGSVELDGEALVVAIAGNRQLFVLLEGDEFSSNLKYLALRLLSDKIGGTGTFPDLGPKIVASRQALSVPPELYPYFVMFRDISDPSTAVRIEPANMVNQLGAGYALRSIALSVTERPRGPSKIKRILPWLPSYYSLQFDGDRYRRTDAANKFANSLNPSLFVAGQAADWIKPQ